MKNLNILAASLLLVLCRNGAVHAVDHTCGAVCKAQVSKTRYEANKTSLPIYKNSIAEISLGYEGAMLNGTIKLDSGAVLHIVDYNSRDDNEMKSWSKADVLVFKANLDDAEKGLILSAKRMNQPKEEVEPLLVYDVNKEAKSSLSIIEINNEGKFVKLSDDSVWEFSWFNQFATKKWEVGQKVLLQGRGDKNSYEFINLSAPFSLKVAIAKGSYVI